VTAFDYIVIGIVVLSVLLGFARGFFRVVVSFAAWVFAVILAIHLSPVLGVYFPELGGSPTARYLIAFTIVVIVVLMAGALLGWMLHRLARAVGLGFLDRLLGGVAGVALGALIVVVGVLAAGMTNLPRQDWWQNAWLSPPFVAAALSLKPWLPQFWAEHLDYGKSPRPMPKPAVGVGV
jgi:membrane protein required for colicin V production